MGQEILLDTGTNEVELLEFFLGDRSFAINVSKILQITTFDASNLTEIPDSHPKIMGVILWRGKPINLINLHQSMNTPQTGTVERPIVLVSNFNDCTNAFLTDGVSKIHRISWSEIKPVSSFLEGFSNNFTGTVHIDDKELFLIDFEYIISDVYPETILPPIEKTVETETKLTGREQQQVVLIEDSPFIRANIKNLLKASGYSNIQTFENGADAYKFLQKTKIESELGNIPIKDVVGMIICDIEMPKMDGLTLTKKIRDDLNIATVPIIILSSLVNDQMSHKCREVGASAYTTKSQTSKLIRIMDKLARI